MNKNHQLILATVLVSISFSVIAEPLSYTFISAEYQTFTVDIDGASEELEGDGVAFAGSLSIGPEVAIIGGYATGSADVTISGTTIDVDIKAIGVGALFHTPISTSIDFIVGFRLLRGEADVVVDGSSFDSETIYGNDIFLGVRSMVSEKVELSGGIARTKYNNSDSSTDLGFGLGYYVTPTTSLDVGYSLNNDGNTLSLGITKYF